MAKHPQNLTGLIAAVTGAARGIGRATAEAFVRQGMKVAIGDLDVEQAQRTADEIGRGTVAVELNVTERPSVERFLDEAEQRLGAPVDVLVNNAGIMQLGRFWEEDDATAQRMIDINLHGVIFGTKAALQRMLPRNRGAIVNIASQAGMVAIEERSAYCTSKAGMIHLTKSLALEWAAELLSRIPAGRFGEPEDIVGAVAFLLSDAASMVTGHTITVDGGYTIH